MKCLICDNNLKTGKKYCSCKCKNLSQKGKPTRNKNLTKKSDSRLKKIGIAVKKYQRMFGNGMQGKKHSDETKEKIRKKAKTKIGKLNGNWRGDDIKYAGLHNWVRKELGQPMKCTKCKKTIGDKRKINWANISGEYKRDLKDWKRLCTKCHLIFDKNRLLKNKKICRQKKQKQITKFH